MEGMELLSRFHEDLVKAGAALKETQDGMRACLRVQNRALDRAIKIISDVALDPRTDNNVRAVVCEGLRDIQAILKELKT